MNTLIFYQNVPFGGGQGILWMDEWVLLLDKFDFFLLLLGMMQVCKGESIG